MAARRADVLKEEAEKLRAEIPGAEVRFQVCDITKEEDVQRAVAAATGGDGQLDIAVANAGSGAPGPILALSSDAWRFVTDLNILGTALTIKHAGLAMRERGGSIVAISSVASSKVGRYMAPYSVSKAGLEMLVRCAALELAPFKIRVNAIAPGYVPTEGTAMAFDDADELVLLEHTPLGRPGATEEIGDGVLYFSADSGAWVTGQVITIDGGMAIPEGEDYEKLCRRIYPAEVIDACTRPQR
jgi:NAD(P)-dependent dehydrogenase (short-subunit alcohol dehydrogenase family)